MNSTATCVKWIEKVSDTVPSRPCSERADAQANPLEGASTKPAEEVQLDAMKQELARLQAAHPVHTYMHTLTVPSGYTSRASTTSLLPLVHLSGTAWPWQESLMDAMPDEHRNLRRQIKELKRAMKSAVAAYRNKAETESVTSFPETASGTYLPPN